MPPHAHSDFREWAGAGALHEDGECARYGCRFPSLPAINKGFYRCPNTTTRVQQIMTSHQQGDAGGS